MRGMVRGSSGVVVEIEAAAAVVALVYVVLTGPCRAWGGAHDSGEVSKDGIWAGR